MSKAHGSKLILIPPPEALVHGTGMVVCTSEVVYSVSKIIYTVYIRKKVQLVHLFQIILPEDVSSRYCHSLTATSLAPGLVEVTVFGGATKWEPHLFDFQQSVIADTAVLTLGE